MGPADTLDTPAGPLTIQPVNHASLVLLFGDQAIYADPVGPAKRYDGLPRPTLVLLTHQHGDHLDPESIAALATPRTRILGAPIAIDQLNRPGAGAIRQGEVREVHGVRIEAIPAHNLHPEKLNFHPKGLGNGYVLTFAGKRVYVPGDTEDVPEMLALTDIDVAFLPMNKYTMTGGQAARAVTSFKPKVVYPFHYVGGAENVRFAEALKDFAETEVRQREWYLPD